MFVCKINEKLSGSKSGQKLLKLKVVVSKQPSVSGTFIQATINFNSIFCAKVRIEPPMMEDTCNNAVITASLIKLDV